MTDLALQPLPQPRRVIELSPVAQTFKALKARSKHQEVSRVVKLAFSPQAPYPLAVVSGTTVGIWKRGKEGAVKHASISKFKDMTQCVAWRSDGRLLLAGEASGSCAVVEVESKKVLRRFMGHGDAVTCCAFADADKTRAVTGGRDGRLRVWDVATCELLQTIDAHSDCIKAVASGPGGPDAWISAGSDGRVRLWDLRTAESSKAAKVSSTSSSSGILGAVSAADHGHPIEDGTVYPGGTMYITAGGPVVKVWDFTMGARLAQEMKDIHSKVVTSVSLDSKAAVLLTASFDGLVKAHQAATLDTVWTYKLDGPATCAVWRPDGVKSLAIGLDDGQWQLREQQVPEADAKPAAPKEKSRARTDGHLRGLDSTPGADDEFMAAERPRKKREKQVEFLFRKFEYRKAVEFMVQPSTDGPLGFSIVEELLQRGALASAFTELGPDLCLQTLTWLLKAFGGEDFLQRRLFEEVLHTLIDHNRCLKPPCTPELIAAVGKLENKVTQELRMQEALMETSGMLKACIGSR